VTNSWEKRRRLKGTARKSDRAGGSRNEDRCQRASLAGKNAAASRRRGTLVKGASLVRNRGEKDTEEKRKHSQRNKLVRT
jgi:hypothetical protein